MQLADSAMPIGSLAHSFGIESLVHAGQLQVNDLPGFLQGFLEEAGFMEAVFCRQAFEWIAFELTEASDRELAPFPTVQWLELNDSLSALKPARESRLGSASLGKNFLTAVAALGDFSACDAALQSSKKAGSLIHHSTAFGLVGGVLGCHKDRVVLAYLHQSTSSLVSACQRLLPLGQNAAMRILWNLKPAMLEVAARSMDCALDDACCFMPLLDWGSMEHPVLPTRLFIT